METETGRMSLKDILENFNKIIIPDVQRDYVMGSGGEKLTSLLTAMAESCKHEKEFDFNCIIGYKDESNNLYIYDGQQRLATLVCLGAYLSKDEDKLELLEKFSFTKRDIANEWIHNPEKIKEKRVVDFTTYSLVQLLKQFNASIIKINNETKKPIDIIDFNFIFNEVKFEMIFVDEISDAEQFFLDINDGLELKSYEIYKAELYHHARQELGKDVFKKFALKMENSWLRYFFTYKTEEICEEEILILFLQYCFRMIWIEKNENDDDFKTMNTEWLKKEDLERIEKIMDAIVNNVQKDDSESDNSYINYSYKSYSEKVSDSPNKLRGQHWNINNTNYNGMLKVFLKNINNTGEINKDVIIWCYISKLPLIERDEDKEFLYEYLRFVKKLLNNNRAECKYANIYHASYFGKKDLKNNRLVYARYYVKGIPLYYNHEYKKIINSCNRYEEYYKEKLYDPKQDGNPKDDKEIYHNVYYRYESKDEKKCDKIVFNTIIALNKEVKLNNFVEDFLYKCKNEMFINILEKEKKKQNSEDSKIIMKYENLPCINGLVDNFIDYDNDSDGTCKLKSWAKNEEIIENLKKIDNKFKQYDEILKYIYDNKINIEKLIFSDVSILWKNYNKRLNKKEGSLIVHTWCDFLTNKNGIEIDKEKEVIDIWSCLPILPDGWIDNNIITQPMEVRMDPEVQKPPLEFASKSYEIGVFNMNSFFENFSGVSINSQGEYIINGEQESSLAKDLDIRDYIRNYIEGNYKEFLDPKKIFHFEGIYFLDIKIKNKYGSVI